MVDSDRELLVESGYSTSLHSVQVRTLSDILSQYEVEMIDFLKVDAEGAEAAVLEGLDLARWRPRVIVVEAVEPYSHVRTDHQWRHLVERAGYTEGCFDGVNLFFGQSDDSLVLNKLVPASAIDDFKTSQVSSLEHNLDEVKAFTELLEDELRRAQRDQVAVTEYARQLENALGNSGNDVVNSSGNQSQPSAGTRFRIRSGARKHLRFAILTTPCTGASWLLHALQEALEAPSLSVDHPGDVRWESLPSRLVLEMPRSRTRLLQKQLGEQDFVVISVSRHPAETLLSIADLSRAGSSPALQSSGADCLGVGDIPVPGLPDDEFLNWATSGAAHRLLCITPSWWVIPSTVRVRVEDFVLGAAGVWSAIIEACGWEGPKPPMPRQIDGLAMDLNQHQSGALAESLRTGDGSQRVYEAHREVFEILGYAP
jgi:hypothetical protein